MKLFKNKEQHWSKDAIKGFNLLLQNEMRKNIKKSDKEYYVAPISQYREYFDINGFVRELELATGKQWKFKGVSDKYCNIYCFGLDNTNAYWE